MTLQRWPGGDRGYAKESNIRYTGTICSRGRYCPFPAVATAHIAPLSRHAIQLKILKIHSSPADPIHLLFTGQLTNHVISSLLRLQSSRVDYLGEGRCRFRRRDHDHAPVHTQVNRGIP